MPEPPNPEPHMAGEELSKLSVVINLKLGLNQIRDFRDYIRVVGKNSGDIYIYIYILE